MQDAPFPPDDDEGNGDQPRRAGLRLRDAEAVATTRRDMFGDGSLIDSLAGHPAVPEGANSPVESNPPEPGAPDASPLDASPPSSAPPEPPSPPEDTQRPSAVAGAGERTPRRKPEPRLVNPAASPFAQVPQSLDSIIDAFAPEAGSQGQEPPDAEPAGAPLQPVPPPGAAPARMAVSSIFDSLGSEEVRAADASQASGAFAPDMSMLGPPLPIPPPAAQDAAPGDLTLGYGPEVEATDDPQGHATAGADATQPTEATAPARDFGRRPLRLVVSSAYAEPPPPVQLPEAPEDIGLPPYPELHQELGNLPSFADPPELADASRYAEHEEPVPGPQLLMSSEAARDPRSLEPLVTTVVPEPSEYAEARIAAEANAAAEALDSLQYRMSHNASGTTEPVRPPGLDGPQLNLLGDPAQFTLHERAPMLPLPVPPERAGVKSVYLLGFLTGLGLAVMAGIALYVLIAMG
jgi:hypothetical protein